jgi:hypothetical protein
LARNSQTDVSANDLRWLRFKYFWIVGEGAHTPSVYGAMQDGYVERFDQKISPLPVRGTQTGRPSFPSGPGSAPEGLMPRPEALWAGGQRGG